MLIDTTKLPTHIAQVGRRLNVIGPDDLAGTFMEASYLAEVAVKTCALVFLSGLKQHAPEHAYRLAFGLVRADGFGIWDSVIRESTSQPLAGFCAPELHPMLVWATRKRTKVEDEWFREAKSALAKILNELGSTAGEAERATTVRELVTAFVQIRNKTKAHGAVGQDFYAVANGPYIMAATSLVSNCPAFRWTWLHLSIRQKGTVRGVLLRGENQHYMTDVEVAPFSTTIPGIHFVPELSPRAILATDLLRSNRECTRFLLPNGASSSSGQAEFINYATGDTSREDISAYASPPAPLPRSETEGLPNLDIRSNVWDNLPAKQTGYVERKGLQDELESKLRDGNHHIITLHGGGGMGKTSLALHVAYILAAEAEPHFEHIVWFSARDVDLRPSGPSNVKPAVVDLLTVAKAFGFLFSIFGVDSSVDGFAKVLQSPKPLSERGILFIFDNFETMSEVTELHKFLDEHTHLPNKILITSRERAFKADYPIEVRGMEYDEAAEMLWLVAKELSIQGLLNDEITHGIYEYTEGHPYVMRVVLGEIAKEGKYTPLKNLLPRRMDIVNAVFERSFNKLSDSGRHVFLIISNWKSEITELALIVVLAQRALDAMSGIEECMRLSLVFPNEMLGEQKCYSVPQLARIYGTKKLQGDPDRLVVQEDLETLRKFGVLGKQSLERHTQDDLVERFVAWCSQEAEGKDASVIQRLDGLLETVATLWPRGWLKLAEFREKCGVSSESIAYAFRRAVEEEPFHKRAWLERAAYAERIHDDATHVASLVSAVEIDPNDVDLIRETAFKLAEYVNAHLVQIPKTRRGVYLASVRSHMERVSDRLDATGLSRLAWLYLLEENSAKAEEYANAGCAKDPTNKHCLNILERLEKGRR